LVLVTFVPFFVAEPVARWMRDSLELAQSWRADPDQRLDPFEVMRGRALAHPPPRATLDDVVTQLEYLRDAVVGNWLERHA